MIRILAALTLLAPPVLMLTACGPSYSPDTYASNAAQQAAKVETGVIAGVRPVRISAQGAVGGVAGAAAGGVAGAQVGAGPTSAFGAIGGSLLGGIAGVASEHLVGDTNGFEYVVRKANGDMVSVAQKDQKPLWIGEKVLVITGPQARVIADYTVPFDASRMRAGPAPGQPAAAAAVSSAHSPKGSAPATQPPLALPAEAAVPPQLPAAFGPRPATPPPIITPPDVASSAAAPASTPPAAATASSAARSAEIPAPSPVPPPLSSASAPVEPASGSSGPATPAPSPVGSASTAAKP